MSDISVFAQTDVGRVRKGNEDSFLVVDTTSEHSASLSEIRQYSLNEGNKFFMVGLPDNTVKESQQRVESAIKFIGYRMPREKVIVNLAPADIRKEGSAYDLTIAIGILAASGQINAEKVKDYVIMGELSLDGSLQSIKGALPIAIQAR